MLKYITSFIIIGILLLIFINNIFLPTYTNKNDTLYVPDVRNLNLLKAQQSLTDLGFNVEIVNSLYSDKYKPNDVISMIPRAF